MNNSNFTIITFYQFKRINDPAILKEELKKFCSFDISSFIERSIALLGSSIIGK